MALSQLDQEGLKTDRLCRWGLSVLVLAWGVQAIVTQSLLLREALAGDGGLFPALTVERRVIFKQHYQIFTLIELAHRRIPFAGDGIQIVCLVSQYD